MRHLSNGNIQRRLAKERTFVNILFR